MPLAVTVELPITSAIPSDYVPERELRLQLYRRLAEIRSEEEINAIRDELDDRFGEPPQEVDNLLFQLKIRIIASKGKVLAISMDNKQILIQLPEEFSRAPLADISREIRISKRGLWLSTRDNPHWKSELINILEVISQRNPVAVY
jgi:transcription-repair coupling factor (superfamily II helicase)